MLEGYETHLQNCGEGRRDLRFKPQVGGNLSELEQFKKLPTVTLGKTHKWWNYWSTSWLQNGSGLIFFMKNFCGIWQCYWDTSPVFWHWQQLGFQKNGARSWTRSMMTIVALFLCLTNAQFRPDVTKAIFSGLWGDGLKGSSIVANSLKNIFNTQVIQRFVLKGVIHLGIKCHQQTTNKIRLTTFFGKPWPSIFRRGWISYPRIYSLFPKA